MTIDRKLLEILRCPVSKQSLRLADQSLLAKINAHIARGDLHSLDGSPISAPWDAALVTVNGGTVYPIRHGWPVMLVDQSVATEQLDDTAAPSALARAVEENGPDAEDSSTR